VGADSTLAKVLERISDPMAGATTGASGALAGTMAASLIASVCGGALESCTSEKAQDDLRSIRDRCLSLRRDLLALVEHGERAASAVAAARRAALSSGGVRPATAGQAERGERERLKALLFASEVPLRTAESCHALLNLSLKALGRAGVKAIPEIGTGAALAFSGVVGGIVTSRSYLAGIPENSGIGAAATRKRAERIFREAESLRTQIIDRVRQHLP
jgi:methenyltetrahydrofolate cyclohydrolase